MSEYRIVFTRSARKDLSKLDAHLVQRIFPRIKKLAAEPRPAGCRKIRGEDDLWRIRVGTYRVLYRIEGTATVVEIVAVRHRKTHIAE